MSLGWKLLFSVEILMGLTALVGAFLTEHPILCFVLAWLSFSGAHTTRILTR